jgi:hypothetical protein
VEATLATLRRLQREDGGNGVGFVQHLGRIMLTNNNLPGRQLSGGGVSRTAYLNTFGCNPASLFSSGPMSHGFSEALRTAMEQRATAVADHFAPLFASPIRASAAAGMAAAPAMSTHESQTAQGATDADQPQQTVAESSTSPTAADPSPTADGADDVEQAHIMPAGAWMPHSPLASSSPTSQTAASRDDMPWWEQSPSPAESTDDGRCLTPSGGQEEAQLQPSSVHGHLRRGAMEAKQRQAAAVDRRYGRISATQANSVKPGLVVVIPFPKDLKGASGSDVGVNVPLCTPCLRDKSAEYLLEELEKTQCVHSLTDALYEFAKRRLHLAYPTQDGLSAMPHTFPCPTPRNRETVPHRICLEPRLNLWCPDADYDGHFDWGRGKKAS